MLSENENLSKQEISTEIQTQFLKNLMKILEQPSVISEIKIS